MDLFNWFFRQPVTEAEIDEAFAAAQNADQDFIADHDIVGVALNGDAGENAGVPDLTIDISAPLVGYDQQGQRIHVPGTGGVIDLDVSVDSNAVSTSVVTPGNEKIVSVFVQFERALSVPRTDGNSATVQFREDESYVLIVEQGAESAAPATPPALRSDALLLCDITRTNPQTTIVDADISLARKENTFSASTAGFTISEGTIGGALQAMLTELQNHVDQVGTAHDADAIDFDNAGTPAEFATLGAAVEVQAAIDGLADDVSADLTEVRRDLTVSNSGNIRYALDGLSITDNSGLIVNMIAGPFWYEGRRYDPTQADMEATAATDASARLTLADDSTTYIGIRPGSGDITNDEDSLEISTSTTGFPVGYCPCGIVTTASGDVTVIKRDYDVLPGPYSNARMLERLVIVPRQVIGNFGADPGAVPVQPGPYTMRYGMEAFTLDDEVLNMPVGPYGLFQQDASAETLEEGYVQFPDGTVLSIEVDVLATHTTENDVNLIAKLQGKSYTTGVSVVGSWTEVYPANLSTQATTDGLAIGSSMGTNSGLGRLSLDGGNGTTGTIRWYIDVTVRVLPPGASAWRTGNEENFS